MKMHPISFNGERLDRDEFAWRTKAGGSGFNPQGIDAIVFWCGNGANRICEIQVTLGEVVDQPVRRWHWNGDMQAPTLTPSIGCDHRCGWHGHITAGAVRAG
jgi:hypothetical protein